MPLPWDYDNWDDKSEQTNLDDEIEQELELIGTTAIEDSKLQDNVKETVQFIKQAGIKLWILTGDHVEAAQKVGKATGLLESNMEVNKIVYSNIENKESIGDSSN